MEEECRDNVGNMWTDEKQLLEQKKKWEKEGERKKVEKLEEFMANFKAKGYKLDGTFWSEFDYIVNKPAEENVPYLISTAKFIGESVQNPKYDKDFEEAKEARNEARKKAANRAKAKADDARAAQESGTGEAAGEPEAEPRVGLLAETAAEADEEARDGRAGARVAKPGHSAMLGLRVDGFSGGLWYRAPVDQQGRAVRGASTKTKLR